MVPTKEQNTKISIFIVRVLKAKKDKIKEEIMEIAFHIFPDKNPVKYNHLKVGCSV
mgnify:CR=1 FL=1